MQFQGHHFKMQFYQLITEFLRSLREPNVKKIDNSYLMLRDRNHPTPMALATASARECTCIFS